MLPSRPALVVWCIAGGLAWSFAGCYTELGSRLPFNRGPQEYLSYCFSDLYGFFASWACAFTLKPCSAAILALVVTDYVCEVLSLARGPFDYVPKLVAISMIALVTVVNCMGNKLSNIVTKSLLVCKIFCVASIIILGFTVLIGPRFSPSVVLMELKSPPRPGLRNYTDATLLAMWAYSGWEAVCVASI
jgi:amino acid transporter